MGWLGLGLRSSRHSILSILVWNCTTCHQEWVYIFDHDGFTSPMVGLVETTRYGRDIVDHGGAITSDGDLMILTEFG